jgi:hypothetical protein
MKGLNLLENKSKHLGGNAWGNLRIGKMAIINGDELLA